MWIYKWHSKCLWGICVFGFLSQNFDLFLNGNRKPFGNGFGCVSVCVWCSAVCRWNAKVVCANFMWEFFSLFVWRYALCKCIAFVYDFFFIFIAYISIGSCGGEYISAFISLSISQYLDSLISAFSAFSLSGPTWVAIERHCHTDRPTQNTHTHTLISLVGCRWIFSPLFWMTNECACACVEWVSVYCLSYEMKLTFFRQRIPHYIGRCI